VPQEIDITADRVGADLLQNGFSYAVIEELTDGARADFIPQSVIEQPR
jgi:hypothetical protein